MGMARWYVACPGWYRVDPVVAISPRRNSLFCYYVFFIGLAYVIAVLFHH